MEAHFGTVVLCSGTATALQSLFPSVLSAIHFWLSVPASIPDVSVFIIHLSLQQNLFWCAGGGLEALLGFLPDHSCAVQSSLCVPSPHYFTVPLEQTSSGFQFPLILSCFVSCQIFVTKWRLLLYQWIMLRSTLPKSDFASITITGMLLFTPLLAHQQPHSLLTFLGGFLAQLSSNRFLISPSPILY